MRSALLLTFAAGALVFAAAPTVAFAQDVTVSGTVVERSQGSWVGGATVRLTGLPPYFTDLDGRFRLPGVAPGRHTLTVEAMGYRPRSMELVVRADTTLVVELDPDPILLDSLLVLAGTIKIEGDIYDAVTGDKVLYAQVRLIPGNRIEGAISGGFTLRKVPRGRAMTVVVESVGYEPVGVSLITRADTTLRVELEHDSVGIRMLAQQVEKLEARSRGVPFPRRILDQDELNRYPGWPIFDIVRTQTAMWGIGFRRGSMTRDPHCIFIDDMQQFHMAFLWGLTPGEVERVEIYDRGQMIRVYTKRFVIGMLGREPGPIVYMKVGLRAPVCK